METKQNCDSEQRRPSEVNFAPALLVEIIDKVVNYVMFKDSWDRVCILIMKHECQKSSTFDEMCFN